MSTHNICFHGEIRKYYVIPALIWSYVTRHKYYACKMLSLIKTSNSIFRENRCPPTVDFQFFYCCDIEDSVKVTKIQPILCYVPIIYPWKFGKNPALVHKILCRQESVTPAPMPMPIGFRPKTIKIMIKDSRAVLMSTNKTCFHVK